MVTSLKRYISSVIRLPNLIQQGFVGRPSPIHNDITMTYSAYKMNIGSMKRKHNPSIPKANRLWPRSRAETLTTNWLAVAKYAPRTYIDSTTAFEPTTFMSENCMNASNTHRHCMRPSETPEPCTRPRPCARPRPSKSLGLVVYLIGQLRMPRTRTIDDG